MTEVRSSAELWRERGGYYADTPVTLRSRPVLPDRRRLRDRRVLALFDRYGNLRSGSRALEVGCGRSPWLPYLRRRHGCAVTGIDVEPFAAELARANLAGAAAEGTVVCRDAFVLEQNTDLRGGFDLVYSMGVIEHYGDAPARLAVLGEYLRPGGRILTLVPNLRGLNWLLQRFGDVGRLEMHVIYDAARLADVHRRAGFQTLAAGCVGFYDGFLSGAGSTVGPVRRRVHRWLCWLSSMSAEAWVRIGRGAATPELAWIAPHVYCVGWRAAGPRP